MVGDGDRGFSAKGDEIPGRRSIEKAIEERLAMTIKGLVVPENSGSEIKVVAKDVLDDDSVSIRSERVETTQVKDLLNSTSTEEVENQQQKGPRREVEIDIHVDCVGDADSVVAGNRVQMVHKVRKSRALRALMVLEDNVGEVSDQISTTAVDKNHSRNFSKNAFPGISYDPSTKQATPTVTEIPNSEKQESEQEAYLLDRLSWLQPSFRTLLEPNGTGNTSPGSSSGNKTEHEAENTKWNKKIEKVVAKVKNSSSKKKQAQMCHGNVLLETHVKDILKMKWEEEKKKRQVKQTTRFPRFCTCFCGGCCCCCSASNNTERTEEDWEFQLGEYRSSW